MKEKKVIRIIHHELAFTANSYFALLLRGVLYCIMCFDSCRAEYDVVCFIDLLPK